MDFNYKKYQATKDFYNLHELFTLAFPKSNHLIVSPNKYKKYLNWLYLQNPFGNPIGYNAYHNRKLVGHYACIPTYWCQDHKRYKALLSLNTAVHPQFQRKGMFSKLAEKTYELAKREGYDFVYAISNKNSTPGFIKLNFALVGKLYVQLCLMTGKSPKEVDIDMRKLSQELAPELLNWRLNRPFTSYSKNAKRIVSKPKNFPVKVISREMQIDKFSLPGEKVLPPSLYFYMGSTKQKMMFLLPNILRPAALNLIYKPLSARARKLRTNLEDWDLDFIDFDLA